jgi:hypothetical protein
MTGDVFDRFVNVLTVALPAITGVTALLAAFTFLARGKIQLGAFSFDFERHTRDQVKAQISEDIAGGDSPQNALMREYHTQGLSQSRISFWFSLIFASFGFAIIALAVGIFLQRDTNPGAGWLDNAGKPIFSLVAGTVIDAVSALFFVQSNKARQLMTDFFDKLRVDRKLDEALGLMSQIPDQVIQSRVKAIVALTFSEVIMNEAVLTAMLSMPEQSETRAGPVV